VCIAKDQQNLIVLLTKKMSNKTLPSIDEMLFELLTNIEEFPAHTALFIKDLANHYKKFKSFSPLQLQHVVRHYKWLDKELSEFAI
jgi:hypothetical protein